MSHEEQIVSTLREILKWIRVQAAPQVKQTLQTALPKPDYKRVYQGLNGKMTQKELAALFKISQPRISQLISAWVKAGIVQETSPGKYLRAFDLEELGITVAETKE